MDKDMTSPYELYQYLMNVADSDVVRYLRLFTFMPLDEIDEYEALVEKSPENREAQKRLAWEVTQLVHGDDEVRLAKKASAVLFGGEVADVTDDALEQIFADVPKTEAAMADLATGIDLIGLLVSSQAAQSRGAARRLVSQGGAYVNNRQIKDASYTVTEKDLASEHFIVLRTGKKKYFLVRFS